MIFDEFLRNLQNFQFLAHEKWHFWRQNSLKPNFIIASTPYRQRSRISISFTLKDTYDVRALARSLLARIFHHCPQSGANLCLFGPKG